MKQTKILEDLVMSDKKRPPSYKTPEELLQTNPRVSKSVVAQYRELKKQLEKLGVEVDTKSRYTLSSPWHVPSNLKGKKRN